MQRTTPPHQISEDLGTLDALWKGWKLRHGMLFDPLTTTTLGWTPSQVRALPYLHDLVHQLRRELSSNRDQLHQLELLIGEAGAANAADKLKRRRERETRQLKTLSRLTQATEKAPRRTSPPVVAPGLLFGPVPGRNARSAVRAFPPGTQRDRK